MLKQSNKFVYSIFGLMDKYFNMIVLGIIGIFIVVCMSTFLVPSWISNNYDYKIEIDGHEYYCNEYKIEDSKLYLEDCARQNIIIHNPVNYRIEEK